jgi:hypothetical protein
MGMYRLMSITISHRQKALIFTAILCVSTVSLFSQEPQAPFRVHTVSDRLTFMENEPVEVSALIKNTSSRTASFFVYDVNYTTFQPVVYGMDGREAETIVQYRLMNRTVQDTVNYIEPRRSSIGSDEKIVKKLDLTDYYRLEPGKEYKVKIFFLPDAKIPQVISSDNTLLIKIAHSEMMADPTVKLPDRHQGNITPSETVLLTLTGEKTKRWASMLKYLYLEKFVSAYPDYAMAYNAGSDPIRKKVLRDFVSFLSTPRADYIVDFDITSESILEDRKTAYVEARVIRNSAPKPYVYLYKYTLELLNGSWYISGIDATVSKERIISR